MVRKGILSLEAMPSQVERGAKRRAVLRALSGNILDVYDYGTYGYFAVFLAPAFFPIGSAFLSLMLALMTFSIAAFARP